MEKYNRINQKKMGIILSYCTMAVNIIISLFFSPFMLHAIGDSQYGVYSLSQSLISFIALLDLGLGQTLVRYISKERALRNDERQAEINGFFLKIYSIIAVAAAVIGVCIIYIYPLLSQKTMTSEEIRLFKEVFAILLVNVVFSFPMCIFSSTINAYERFAFQKTIQLITTFAKYLCMILVLLGGYKVVATTIIAVVVSISTNLIYMFFCKKELKIRFSFNQLYADLSKEIFLFSFFVFLNLIIDFLYNSTDKMILGAVSGTLAVTVYTFGTYFTSYFQELSTAMSGVFLPSIVTLYETKKDVQGISNIFNKVGRLQMALLSLALGGFILLGKEFITLWLGNGYDDAYYIGLIIMLPALIPLTQNIGITVLRAMNLHKYRSYMYLAIAIVNVAISIPLAKLYGGIGAAIGTCLANIAGQIIFMSWFYSKRVGLDIKLYYTNLIKFVLLTGLMVAISFIIKYYLPIYNWFRFVVFALLFSALYCVGYYVFISNEYEKSLLTSFLHKILGRSKRVK